MPRALQVWNYSPIIRGKQRDVIVAAYSRRQAAALMGIGDNLMASHGCRTRNEEHIALACSKPLTLFASADMNYPRIYKEIPPLADGVKSN